jgi:hypothetical protein
MRVESCFLPPIYPIAAAICVRTTPITSYAIQGALRSQFEGKRWECLSYELCYQEEQKLKNHQKKKSKNHIPHLRVERIAIFVCGPATTSCPSKPINSP